jgi:mono/diheme cytochrome c family protein
MPFNPILKLSIFTCAIICAVAALSHAARQSQPQRTTKDRVYTDAQAARGEALASKIGCGRCHGPDLDGGGDETPPLWGIEFTSNWYGTTLRDLNLKLNEMPPDAKEKLRPQDYADLAAFLLQINGYPAGQGELPPESEALAQIRFVDP